MTPTLKDEELVYPRRVDANHDKLTPRLRQISECIWRELSNKEIAFELSLAEGTIKCFICQIFTRLRVRNRVGVALWWERNKDRLGEM